MNIAVVGSGYVGLVTGACFAEFGNHVTCVDKDVTRIEKLQAGIMPIYEPGLDTLVAKNVRDGRLQFSVEVSEAVKKALVVFLAVGTPSAEDGSADLGQVFEAAREIARHLEEYKVIVTKSTVPVGTAARVRMVIEENKASTARFSVVSNPEFLREGAAINDFMRPDRVVIGYEDEAAAAILKDLYRPLYQIAIPFVLTRPESAELIKYASNAFLAIKVSFINEVANLCDIVGANVVEVSLGVGLDDRIGAKFLQPGPGFGGSCFPKDTQALEAIARSSGTEMRLVQAAMAVNERQKASVVERIQQLVPELSGKTIALLGLSFKPETDDLREAPALRIIEDLQKAGAHVKAYDPVAMQAAAGLTSDVEFCEDEYLAATAADALVVVTEWNQFRSLDFERLKRQMRQANLVDLRNVYEPQHIRDAGFAYVGIGRN
jgi:UDPglucose 6-dehydrogenase